MNLEQYWFPASAVQAVNALLEENGGLVGFSRKNEWTVSVDSLEKILAAMGCVRQGENEKMNELGVGKMKLPKVEANTSVNQEIGSSLPEALVEEWLRSGNNLLRATMDHLGLSLKELAEQYGGSSAAANLSNLFARSDEELQTTRSSTLHKIARAMDCPEDWFDILKHPEAVRRIKEGWI